MIDITIAVIVVALYVITAPAINRWDRKAEERNALRRAAQRARTRPAFPDTTGLECGHRYRQLVAITRGTRSVRWLVCRTCGGVEAALVPTRVEAVDRAA